MVTIVVSSVDVFVTVLVSLKPALELIAGNGVLAFNTKFEMT